MKFSLKITLCMLCLISVLFGIGGSLVIGFSFDSALERERQSAYSAYQNVLATLQVVNSMSNQVDYDDIGDTLKQLSNQNTGTWKAISLYTDEKSVYEYGSFNFSAVERDTLDGHCSIQYCTQNHNEHCLIVSGKMEVGNQNLYLDVVRDISSVIEQYGYQQRIYQIVFLFLILLCAILSFSLSRVITKPLSELSKASQAISKGDLSRRARIKSNDEVGHVAHDFNIMVDHLENNINQQERFIAAFAHETKTPMTSIIGYADLIRGQTLTEEEISEAANFIVSEGRRLEGLSQKLMELLVVKNGAAEFHPVSPAILIQSVCEYMAPVYKKYEIQLSCACESGMCLLESDLFKTLILNLCDNARKALCGREGYIRIHSSMLCDGVKISVEDNGRGIPAESLVHLTEAFYRVDKSRSREQGGAGLGLALCAEIVSLHNGSIRFESEPDHGTKVIVELRGGSVCEL